MDAVSCTQHNWDSKTKNTVVSTHVTSMLCAVLQALRVHWLVAGIHRCVKHTQSSFTQSRHSQSAPLQRQLQQLLAPPLLLLPP